MRAADWIDLLFFSLFIALAWLRPLARQRRSEAIIIGAAGIGLTLAVRSLQKVLPPLTVLVIHDWSPAPVMLMVYWQAGRFFRVPNEKLQTRLARFDSKVLGAAFRFPRTSQWPHRWIARYLEFSYLFCYPLVPLGIGVLYATHMGSHADEYWAIVLPSAYLCYAFLPFAQTLPPRMLAPHPRSSVPPGGIRALNLWILRHASIQVNTFPSAHVAATIAASLALLRFVTAAGLVFLWVSISIAVGAVLGRYHYAADALLGATIASVVFLVNYILQHSS